jgi:hypothetical protein
MLTRRGYQNPGPTQSQARRDVDLSVDPLPVSAQMSIAMVMDEVGIRRAEGLIAVT